MECIRCHRTMGQVPGMLPIDPRGTPDRRWVCVECATQAELEEVPKNCLEICHAINSNFPLSKEEVK